MLVFLSKDPHSVVSVPAAVLGLETSHCSLGLENVTWRNVSDHFLYTRCCGWWGNSIGITEEPRSEGIPGLYCLYSERCHPLSSYPLCGSDCPVFHAGRRLGFHGSYHIWTSTRESLNMSFCLLLAQCYEIFWELLTLKTHSERSVGETPITKKSKLYEVGLLTWKTGSD